MRNRDDKYESKLAIDGSFEDVIKVMVTPRKTESKKEEKHQKGK
jgi:hypothetical protein